ncbi:MAG TPA: SMP-30/gluconolactonase/LRE family protein [Pirellulales bacterium]|nr:SMP-30/gluconolactonase/LRE family protein [Pirellulales bacterium]
MTTVHMGRARFVSITILTLAQFTISGKIIMAEDTPAEIKSFSAPYPTFGKLESKDPRFDKLISPDTKIEKLAEGFQWCEGPVWVKDGGFLLFSDIPRNSLMKWKQGEGVSVYMHPSGYTGITDYGHEPGSNANTLDADGRLVQCEHGDRRISVLTKDGGKRTLADNYQGKRLNSPNDLVFKSNGDLYFTDPIYGLPKHENDPRREIDFCGVFLLRRMTRKDLATSPAAGEDWEIILLTKDLTRPNGLAFSPDEKKVYVANSDPDHAVWMVYDVVDDPSSSNKDGTLKTGRIFFDATAWTKAGKKGLPDGMKVDRDGNLWAAGPGGLSVFAPDGTHLGTINPDTGDPVSNCAWGDDGSTLYMTVNNKLARIKTNAKGAAQIKFSE